MEIFIELREQAVRDKAAEVTNIERVERFFNELAEAPSIIERLPQDRREELINKLRRVQLLLASEASQAEAHHFSASGSSRGRPETAGIGRSAEVRNCTLLSKDQAQRERDIKRNGSGSAMEVDQGDQEGERPSASKNFMKFLGTLNFNQRASGRHQFVEAGKDNGQSASTGAMDAFPLGPTLPTSTIGSPQILVPNLINPKPPPPPNARPARNADQADAMATQVEKIYQQKEKEKEQYKAVLMQKENEFAQAKQIQRVS